MRVGARNLSLSAAERAVLSVGGVAELAAASVSVGVSTSVDAVVGDAVTLSTNNVVIEALSTIRATATDVAAQVGRQRPPL